jgi:arginine exporter protein ArgO
MRPFLSGIVAGYGVAVPVGAIGILIIETGLRNGLRKGLAAGAGAATADLIYAVVAVIGGAGAAAAIGDIGPGFRYVGGVVLVVMALLGIRRAISQDGVVEVAAAERGAGRTYAAFLGLTLVNPMTVLYFAAVVMGLGLATGMTPVEGIAFIAGAAVASLSWQWLLAFGGFTLGSRLSERARRWLGVAGNLLVLGLAVTIFLG